MEETQGKFMGACWTGIPGCVHDQRNAEAEREQVKNIFFGLGKTLVTVTFFGASPFLFSDSHTIPCRQVGVVPPALGIVMTSEVLSLVLFFSLLLGF